MSGINKASASEINKYIELLLNKSLFQLNESHLVNDSFNKNTLNSINLDNINNVNFPNISNSDNSKSDKLSLNNSCVENKHRFSGKINLDKDFFITENTKLNDKLILPPSCFPSGCVCGHLHEFRCMDFGNYVCNKSSVYNKLKITPVKIKLRSQR